MLNEVVIKAPAKLNLHLKVYPRRDDGYHNIESLFQAIDFFDDLIVTKMSGTSGCTVEVLPFSLPLENTLTVAYKVFCAKTGIRQGVHIKLLKRIYSGAGLGGGSSNGAAVINALDVLFNTNLSHREKMGLALDVGSDVPFFFSTGAAVVTGRGEYIREIQPRKDLYFVLIMPNVHSSTKEAFAFFDELCIINKTQTSITLDEIEDVYRSPVTDWSFTNSFTDLLVSKYSCIGKALNELQHNGAQFVQMSGSGASVYGVFNTEEDAKKAYTQLSIGWECYLARTYSISR